MKTTVKNLLTNENYTFINELSLIENVVNVYIYSNKTTSKLLDKDYREKIKIEFNIKETVSKVTGKPFVYCDILDLYANYN